MLTLSASLLLVALGATAAELQPSAQRVAVTGVVGLLAPLFWPGNAGTPARNAMRIAAWSGAAAGLAALLLRGLGPPAQPLARILASCAMLLPIMLVTHAMLALLERHWCDMSVDMHAAREMAGRTMCAALALLGTVPLWLGPLGELLSARHDWLINMLVSTSPLTHLAVASDNDLLRNQWFYQHSNLANLQFSYPGIATLSWSYGTVLSLLACIALMQRRSRRPLARKDSCTDSTPKENAP
ncbi:hypothetical protein [Paucibacter soli]|uniref:hypothetical protein n=1 Tax=Paucibacter soli TaxID=3133433 RepID=UPI0030983A26